MDSLDVSLYARRQFTGEKRMNRNVGILELNTRENMWNPPVISEKDMANTITNDVNVRQGMCYFHIFRTEPYIDSIYIEYDRKWEPILIKRFAFHEGYIWDRESEEFFNEHCVKTQQCGYSGGQINRIYAEYKKLRPEWHLQRYFANGLRLLDHIYNCLKENTAKEILYKAGLDELAANIDEIDELNLLATKPSDIYDGLTMKVLRSVNCYDGATLVNKAINRRFIKALNQKYPDLFEDKLNDAQCRYLANLIKGNLTIGEVGRLFRSRKNDLAKIWCKSIYDLFMAQEEHNKKICEMSKIYGAIDPIYENYIKNVKNYSDDRYLKQLEFFLVLHRDEYDRCIRRSNRKRDYNCQERGEKYIVRYPQTINDFCRESIYMQNCLLTYVEAIVENDTTILFMRKVDDVNLPFITLEIYNGELMQAYHRFNIECSVEEIKWILDYCNRHGIKAKNFVNVAVDE